MDRLGKGIWIPMEICKAVDLSWHEKILLMAIDSYTSQGRECYFSNEFIGEMLGVKQDAARRLLSSLIKKGYVRKVRFDGRKRYISSCLEIQSDCEKNPTLTVKKNPCRLGKKSHSDCEKNHMQTVENVPCRLGKKRHDNKLFNKQDYNIPPISPQGDDVGKEKDFVPPTPNDVAEYAKSLGFASPEGFGHYFVGYYDNAEWVRTNGKPVKNWKNVVLNVWLPKDKDKDFSAYVPFKPTTPTTQGKSYVEVLGL